MAQPPVEQVDAFGLWQAREAASRAESFALPEEGSPPTEEQGMVWSLDLSSGAGASLDADAVLAQREKQVQALEAGLDQAVVRAERTLARHRAAALGEPVSFSINQPAAEVDLSAALLEIDPGEAPTSFALGLPSVNWGDLTRRFDQFMEGVNRQVLHYAWIETKVDGAVVARTLVHWGGDMNTSILPRLGPRITEAHARSMTLALAARGANMRAAITVMQIAAKIALAVTTPIGVVQALALAWQFVYGVIVPLLEEARG